MKYKLLITFILFSGFILSQDKYNLLIQEAQKKRKEWAFDLYSRALEINPNGYEALVGCARYNLDEAATQRKKEDRDSLFVCGLNLLERAAVADTSKQTFINLLMLDGYNKNLRVNYERIYTKDQIFSFFDRVTQIYNESQKRYDFKNYDAFEQIYNMLMDKRNKYIIYHDK